MPPLIPAPAQLAKLTKEQTEYVLRVIERANAQEHSFAVITTICGTVCFLADLGAFVYLIMHGHTGSASAVFGAGLLAIVLKLVTSRLKR